MRVFKRDRKGRFARTSGGKAAKAQLKSDRKRNKAGYKSRVRGSRKARLTELKQGKKKRSKAVIGGAAQYAFGKAIKDRSVSDKGKKKLGKGVGTNLSRVRSTKALSRGLKKSQNRAAKKRYKAKRKAYKRA